MMIKKYELKKILSSPVFIILTAVFLFYNISMIMLKLKSVENINQLNSITDKVGYKITDDMMSKFKIYYEDKLIDANNILNKKGYEKCNSIGEFLYNHPVSEKNSSKFTSEEAEILNDLHVTETYYYSINNLKQQLSNTNIKEIEKHEVKEAKYSETVKNIIKSNYNDFSKRFNEIKSNEESNYLFFDGSQYGMHSFLFEDILKNVIIECMILTVLASALILNYEFDNKTYEVAYTSKRGRNLIKDKIFISLLSSVIITTKIVSVTLIIYFFVFNYSGVLKTSMNSFFMRDDGDAYFTWYPMSFIKYLVLSIIMVYIVEIIFCIITICLSVFVKNTYILFILFMFITVSGTSSTSLIPDKFTAHYISIFTPFTLINHPSQWFMFRNSLPLPKNYEVITLSVWIIALIAAALLCIRRFKVQDFK